MQKSTIKISNAEVLKLLSSFSSIIEDNYTGLDFGYGVLKNKKILNDQKEILVDLVKPTSQFQEFELKRQEILKTHATDSSGNLLTEDMGGNVIKYNILEANQNAFDIQFQELKEEYSTYIVEHEKKQNDYEVFLSKEVELEIFKMSKDVLPENLKMVHLETLLPFIQDIE